jgi:hypothetical protein
MKSGKSVPRRPQTAAPPAAALSAPAAAAEPAQTPAPAPAPAAPPVAPSRRARQALYFVNAPVDFALAGGVSITTFLLLRMFHSGQRGEAIYTTAAALSWVVNWPHFSATSYRLYHDRAHVRQYPVTALLIPWLVLAAVVGSVFSPTLVAPYFIKLYLTWSPYHFSGQTLGVTLIYARRAGFSVGRWERLALSTFIFGSFATQNARFEVNPAGAEYYGITYPGLGLPEWTVTVLSTAMYVGGAVFLLLAARWCLRERRWLPPVVLLPAATQFVWFIPGNSWASFQEFVPFFHSLQYLLIAWSVQLKEKLDKDHLTPGVNYVVWESARWGILNIVGGAILFFMLPRLMAETGVDLTFATGVVLTGVQIHHFFVDGVIWKLRRTTPASPLMVNLADMLSPAPAPTPALQGRPA